MAEILFFVDLFLHQLASVYESSRLFTDLRILTTSTPLFRISFDSVDTTACLTLSKLCLHLCACFPYLFLLRMGTRRFFDADVEMVER